MTPKGVRTAPVGLEPRGFGVMSAWTWNATDDGYEASDGRARLVKRPKGGRSRKFDWFLVLPSGAEHALPGRASFDHAERLLAALKG